MNRKPELHRHPWTSREHRLMLSLAKKKLPAAEIARALKRTAPAVQQRLMNHGVSLRAMKRAGARPRA